ncbi:DDB1- and CUL4-associated factor 13, partial [Tremellales sp. Uapishka_1]
LNPAVPLDLLPKPSSPSPLVAYNQRTPSTLKSYLVGAGPERRFLSIWDSVEPHPGFPSRPTPGGVLDLDLVLEKCDLNTNKVSFNSTFMADVSLDNGRRVRRGNYLGSYKQIYLESSSPAPDMAWSPRPPTPRSPSLSRTALELSAPLPVAGAYDERDPCDPRYPRIFHMFWAGPFSDKPYMAVMSFLFTQNLGLDTALDQRSSDTVKSTCRPQFWVWINPGPAAAVPNPSAKREMYEELATNPWSAPFLHERFREVVKFKMWNTTEQLDGVDELRDHWRAMSIFNSGGNTYKQPAAQPTPTARDEDEELKRDESLIEEATAEAPVVKKGKNGLFEKVGSSSESDYDRLSVILSDMARFVLTHRFGGVYLDADTIFLRDWEELWNYRGQFAYRWSWHQKYNTAILKLHKGSALSSFLFKTALENGLDFHPMVVSRYLRDAGLEKLLFRVPDALFDPAWLNMERYQRERPPFPYFPEWLPFDPSRNWPDLGPRFARGENLLKAAAREALSDGTSEGNSTSTDGVSDREDMDDEIDLSWSTVLKRTFEAYLRAERPNMYGEWLEW